MMITWRKFLGTCLFVLAAATAATSRADTLTQWQVPFAESQPFKLAVDGTRVFYLDNGFEQQLGRLDTASNQFVEWTLPYIATSPSDLARRPTDGTLFMTGANIRFDSGDAPPGEIGQFDPASQLLRRWPVVAAGDGPWSLAIDDQGMILFAASDIANGRAAIGRLDPATGTVTTWVVPDVIADQTGGQLASLPGGSVFFNNAGAGPQNVIVLDTTTGIFTAWQPPQQPLAIATDDAGSLFFQEQGATTAIARLVPATGRLTEWITPGSFNDDLLFAFNRVFFGSIAPTGLAALNPAAPGTDSALSPIFVDAVVPNSTAVTPSETTLVAQQAPGRMSQRDVQRRHAGAFTGWAIASSPRMLAAGANAVYFGASSSNAIGRISP